MRHLFLIVILKTGFAFGMENFAYPLTLVSHKVTDVVCSLAGVPVRSVRYYKKYYNYDTQNKILGLNDSPEDEAKNKEAYDSLELFIKNMDHIANVELNAKIKNNIYVALSRGPYIANIICDMIWNRNDRNPMLDCSEEVRIAHTLLSKHITALIAPLKMVTKLGLIGQSQLPEEYRNGQGPMHFSKKNTKLAYVYFLVECIEKLAVSINISANELFQEVDPAHCKSFIQATKTYLEEE
ncbi:MAG TPA: hypothetical protein VL201_02970 [Patescibacteria group bacterium]|jgi:hypothetical protein|nr:hypothetical protein [Patescibacteria group bacterium]